MYDFEIDRILGEIKRLDARRVLLQFPDGLKSFSLSLIDELQSRVDGVDFLVHVDPCYGGCDVALDEAKRLNVDLVVHFGHTQFIRGDVGVNVLYIPAFSDLPVDRAVHSAINLLRRYSVVGVLSTVQHVHKLGEVCRLLEEAGFRVVVGGRCGRNLFDGQILGCDVCSALSIVDEVDVFLVVAGGDFHALGVALSTGKPVIVADPYRGEARDISRLVKRTLSLRWASIMKARDAQVFGVIVGVKPGQVRVDVALRVRDLILSCGRKCYLFAGREISPEAFYPFIDRVDVFVVVACPRIVIDDAHRFRKPIITVGELKIALNVSRGDYTSTLPLLHGEEDEGSS